MHFEQMLARAGEVSLQQLVGRPVIKLLTQLDPALAAPAKLRKIVLGLHPPRELLLEPETRAELLLLLPRDEAVRLVALLGLDVGDPYAALSTLRVRRGSRRAGILLDFFGVVEPELPAAERRQGSVELTPRHTLFAHQRRAARSVTDLLEAEPYRVLLHMPTGSGKTRTAMNVVCQQLNVREPRLVVWLAHSEELCEQAVEEFERAWTSLGNRSLRVHRWWGEHELDINGAMDGLVVAGLAKAVASAKSTMELVGPLASQVGLVVMDEAHQAVAPTYAFILDFFTLAGSTTPLLGLTATPGRSWSDIAEDEKLADFFYRKRVSLVVEGYDNPVDYLVAEGYLARAHFESLLYSSGMELSSRDLVELSEALDIPERLVARLAADEQRNLFIVQRIEQLLRHHARTLVFAANVDHARTLATVLRARGYDAASLTGTTGPEERSRLIEEFKSDGDEPKVLVNFGVLTTGFDAPRTSAAVIARPTKSLVLYSQMVGRAIRGRRAGGNDEAIVVTVVDTQLPGFASPAEAFNNWNDVWGDWS